MQRVITALAPQRRHPGRVNIHVDGAFCCGAALEVVAAERLRIGTPACDELLERLRDADERWRARDAAFALLAVRPRARRELADRLRGKGFPAPAVEAALAEADRLGLLDDAAFAEAWVRDRIRLRPRGRRGLLDELRRKGVAGQVADAAVAAALDDAGVDERALCREAAARWLRTGGVRVDRSTAGRRLRAYLLRRGFGSADIRSALAALL